MLCKIGKILKRLVHVLFAAVLLGTFPVCIATAFVLFDKADEYDRWLMSTLDNTRDWTRR